MRPLGAVGAEVRLRLGFGENTLKPFQELEPLLTVLAGGLRIEQRAVE